MMPDARRRLRRLRPASRALCASTRLRPRRPG
jgi:hypothetical protein